MQPKTGKNLPNGLIDVGRICRILPHFLRPGRGRKAPRSGCGRMFGNPKPAQGGKSPEGRMHAWVAALCGIAAVVVTEIAVDVLPLEIVAVPVTGT